MYRLLCLCLWIGALSCADIVKVQKPATSALPQLKIVSDSSGKALRISKLAVNVRVTGNVATTTFDITFCNDQDRQLEGEFDFPLANGQAISRYALEVNGSLREGVVVEKAKARVAFESTVRRKIDPGLVEKTKGNHFRTRVYPIPARGYKRIVIGVEQVLQASAEGFAYELPLAADTLLDAFALSASVARPSERPRVGEPAPYGFHFASADGAWSGSVQKGRYQPLETFAFTLPLEKDSTLLYTEARGGTDYFYAWLPAVAGDTAREAPRSITLLWDVSASAAQRDLAKENALLRAYLSALNNVTVTVVPFAIQAGPPSVFQVHGGDAAAVLDYVQRQTGFDGGTQLGALDLQQFAADEILLFSDGISTFGKGEIGLSATPVTVVSTAPGADYSYLKYIARQTGGRFVDLSVLDAQPAAEGLLRAQRQFLRADYRAGAVDSLVTPVQTGLPGGFAVAGMLKGDSATITLHFGYGKTSSGTRTLVVRKGQAPTAGVGRIWASLLVDELDLQYRKNKEAITALGKRFSIVTQNTSLLVLDRVEDYVAQEIEPPADLLAEYRALLKEKRTSAKEASRQAMAEAETAMRELVAWWQAPVQKKPSVDAVTFSAPVAVADDRNVSSTSDTTVVTTATTDLNATYPYSPSPEGLAVTTTDVALEKSEEPSAPAAAPPAIEVQEWKADAPYLAELEAAPPAGRYRKYLSLKATYATQPSFYIDAARFFYAKNDVPTAIRVLSNVAELKLENPELLRNMAEQLQEFGQTALALETFRQILELREEEPQAYRDLALACNEAGNYSEAVQLLYKVATGAWDARFGGMREVALCELNAILSAHRPQVDLSGIDEQFVRDLPIDVRIVIGWSADNSDVDLWVTDPRNEKCFYENTHTALGGRISEDATQGYGPEQFLLKKAANGDYAIDANLYGDRRETLGGPITIKAELFTDYGRPTQQRKVISFRLTDKKEVVRIGKLVFGRGG
ncbi:VIT domain-containing protein [Flaviaesturariibacter aridisoli]|nr:VIT domain-containing protein [Flaviaesturariibacter aridisoli]